jgi:hypothetical protein
MALIDDLLQQAVRGCGELSGEMERAEGSLDGLLARSQAVGAAVANRTGEARRQLQDLTARLASAERAVHDDGQQTRRVLVDLGQEGRHLEERAGALMRSVRAGLAEMEARRAELEAQQRTRVESSDASAAAITTSIAELEAAVDAGLQEASTAIASFRGELDRAREGWRAQVDAVDAELGRATDATRAQARVYVAAIEGDLEQDIAALAHEVPHDLVIGPHNQAIAGLTQKLTEEAKAELAEALDPVRQALEDLGRGCGGDRERLQQELGEAVKKVEATLQRLVRMRPSWALAQRLG